MKVKKYNFTLIEMFVAFFIIAMTSGVIGLKMHGVIKKKKITTDIERIQSRLVFAHKMALITNVDWIAEFTKENGTWSLQVHCKELNQKDRNISLCFNEISFEKKRKNQYLIHFYSTGNVIPQGIVELSKDSEKRKIDLSDLFKFTNSGS